MNNYSRLLLLSVSMLLNVSAQAIDATNTGLFSNTAIKGYDTVAYFQVGQAVKGDDAFQAQYQGATWLFSNAENLALFTTDPAQYAPQYGGYCAYAVANNTTASIKPELFTIHEGKLYLNYSASINQKWRADKDGYIQAANKNWPGLLND